MEAKSLDPNNTQRRGSLCKKHGMCMASDLDASRKASHFGRTIPLSKKGKRNTEYQLVEVMSLSFYTRQETPMYILEFICGAWNRKAMEVFNPAEMPKNQLKWGVSYEHFAEFYFLSSHLWGYLHEYRYMVRHDFHFHDIYRNICSIHLQHTQGEVPFVWCPFHLLKFYVYTLDTIPQDSCKNRLHSYLICTLCSYLYHITISYLIQAHSVPSSITYVNSMEVSDIPIAEARGFTTHLIRTCIDYYKRILFYNWKRILVTSKTALEFINNLCYIEESFYNLKIILLTSQTSFWEKRSFYFSLLCNTITIA